MNTVSGDVAQQENLRWYYRGTMLDHDLSQPQGDDKGVYVWIHRPSHRIVYVGEAGERNGTFASRFKTHAQHLREGAYSIWKGIRASDGQWDVYPQMRGSMEDHARRIDRREIWIPDVRVNWAASPVIETDPTRPRPGWEAFREGLQALGEGRAFSDPVDAYMDSLDVWTCALADTAQRESLESTIQTTLYLRYELTHYTGANYISSANLKGSRKSCIGKIEKSVDEIAGDYAAEIAGSCANDYESTVAGKGVVRILRRPTEELRSAIARPERWP